MAKRKINESSPGSLNEGTGGQQPAGDVALIVNEAVKKATEPLKEDLNEYKVKIIEVLAIFVALFTFVSVDIQIFKSEISALSAAGFTLIMLAGLLLFIIALAYLLDDKRINGLKLSGAIIFSVIIGGFGLYCVGYDYSGVEKILREKFYTKTEVDKLTTGPVEILKQCMKENSTYYPCVSQ